MYFPSPEKKDCDFIRVQWGNSHPNQKPFLLQIWILHISNSSIYGAALFRKQKHLEHLKCSSVWTANLHLKAGQNLGNKIPLLTLQKASLLLQSHFCCCCCCWWCSSVICYNNQKQAKFYFWQKYSPASLCPSARIGVRANKEQAGTLSKRGELWTYTQQWVLCITNGWTVAFMVPAEYQWQTQSILFSGRSASLICILYYHAKQISNYRTGTFCKASSYLPPPRVNIMCMWVGRWGKFSRPGCARRISSLF